MTKDSVTLPDVIWQIIRDLRRLGMKIDCLEDFDGITASQVLRVPNVGNGRLRTLEALLAEHGISLAEPAIPPRPTFPVRRS